jgi:predicted ArsR family transcriptional regulator
VRSDTLLSNGTATSDEAALSMREHKLRQRGQVYGYLLDCRATGSTADEAEAALGIAGNSLRPRLVELREMKLIRASGMTRKTRTGRSAIVWQAV